MAVKLLNYDTLKLMKATLYLDLRLEIRLISRTEAHKKCGQRVTTRAQLQLLHEPISKLQWEIKVD